MRRLGAAVLLFAALCAVSSIVSEEVTRINARAVAGMQEVMALAEQDELMQAEERLREVSKAWHSRHHFLEVFLHHGTLERAEEGFAATWRAAGIDREHFLMEAARLTAALCTLAEGDAAGVGNVF